MGTPDAHDLGVARQIPVGYMVIKTPEALDIGEILYSLNGIDVAVLTVNIHDIHAFFFRQDAILVAVVFL